MAVDTVKEIQLIERSKWKYIGIYEGKQVLSVFFSFFSDFSVLDALLLLKPYTYEA